MLNILFLKSLCVVFFVVIYMYFENIKERIDMYMIKCNFLILGEKIIFVF